MGEVVYIEPWSDEVCESWLSLLADEARRLGYNSEEVGIVMRASAPEAIWDYALRRTAQQIANAFDAHFNGMVQVKNVDVSAENR
jgi:hypothetical protein